MNILFCSSPLETKKIDVDWENEYELAKRYNVSAWLFDYDAFITDGNIQLHGNTEKPTQIQPMIYRGWMLPIDSYHHLYQTLLQCNFRLINSPDEYQHCYYLPCCYDVIKDKTAASVFFHGQKTPNDSELLALLSQFGSKPIIVKDYVKSRKHDWKEACFIPNASDLSYAKTIVANFITRQANHFQGGLVFREFIDMAPIGMHPKSHMPLTQEYRIFILNKKPISCTEYWQGTHYHDDKPINLDQFTGIFSTVRSHFFTVDIAKKKTGDWMIMELGDGQVAEYIGERGAEQLYAEIGQKA